MKPLSQLGTRSLSTLPSWTSTWAAWWWPASYCCPNPGESRTPRPTKPWWSVTSTKLMRYILVTTPAQRILPAVSCSKSCPQKILTATAIWMSVTGKAKSAISLWLTRAVCVPPGMASTSTMNTYLSWGACCPCCGTISAGHLLFSLIQMTLLGLWPTWLHKAYTIGLRSPRDPRMFPCMLYALRFGQ